MAACPLLTGDPDLKAVLAAEVARLNEAYAGSGQPGRNSRMVFEFAYAEVEHVNNSVMNNDWVIPAGRSMNIESSPPMSEKERGDAGQVNHGPREEYAKRYRGHAVVVFMDGSDLLWDKQAQQWKVIPWGGGIGDITMSYVRTNPNQVLALPGQFGNHIAHELGHYFALKHTFGEKVELKPGESSLSVAARLTLLKKRHEERMTFYVDHGGNINEPALAFDNDIDGVPDTAPDSASVYFELLQPNVDLPFKPATFDVKSKPVTLHPDRFNAMSYYGVNSAPWFSPGQIARIHGVLGDVRRSHLLRGSAGLPLLFFNRDTRQWATARLQADGSFDTVFTSEPGEFAAWTHIVGAGNGALLFFNRDSRQWATARLQADGSFDTVFTSKPGEFATWTHIVGSIEPTSGSSGLHNGAAFFYNQGDGQWGTGTLRSDGSFDVVFASAPGSLEKSWTHVVGGDNGAVFFYNQADGQWGTGTLRSDGSFDVVFASEPGSLAKSWTHIT